jgi:hypothetical protein
MTKSQRTLACIFALAIAVLFAPAVHAAELLNFKPVPVSPALDDFTWNGANFASGPGNFSNGDGTAPVATQTAPGLQLDTPFVIPGVPGSTVNPASSSTTFFDASLTLTGFAASGAALSAGGTLIQNLGPGGFSVSSTTGGGGPVLLLTGTISNSTIVGANGGNAGAFFTSTNVTYTGGLIFNALIAAGGSASGGDLSVALNEAIPNFSINAGTGFLNAFGADGDGLFRFNGEVPEPASALAVCTLAGLAIVRRRR